MRVHTDVRGFDFDGDASALFARLTAGRGDVLLFESADDDGANGARSFLFVDSAARIEARGAEVSLVPLGLEGPEAVVAVADGLSTRVNIARAPERITLTFPEAVAANAEDRARVGAASTADVLRAACFECARDGSADEPIRLPGVFAYDHVDRFEALPEVEETAADRLVLDAFAPQTRGGTGRRFDWRPLEGRDLSRVILAGGVDSACAADADAVGAYAIDVGSGVEIRPGIKSVARLGQLFARLRRSSGSAP